MSKLFENLDNMDFTADEVRRLTNCMKDEKFVDMFKEYAQEISKPENRKRYELELAMLEKERGMDVKFIDPKPGHVLKTTKDGNDKCFINICTNEILGKPKSNPTTQGNSKGMQWTIPHSVSQGREDVDRAGNKCTVYDVVFHPDTYYMLTKNVRFKQMIHDTAIVAVERRFGITLSRENIKFPKMKFKGAQMSSVVRTTAADNKNKNEKQFSDWICNKINGGSPTNLQQADECSSLNLSETPKELPIKHVKPNYSLAHRGYFDLQDYSMIPGCSSSRRPKELVITIDLPEVTAANSVDLEVFERKIKLKSIAPIVYKLDVDLPYPVDDSKGFAKFDKSKRVLIVTLEVLQPHVPAVMPSLKDDRLDKYFANKPKEEEFKIVVTKIASGDNESKDQVFQTHSKQGPNWSSDEIEKSDDESFDRSTEPLVKTSEFLMEMIYKYSELVRFCPKYTFFQDEEYITIIVHIKNVFSESIWYVVYDDKLQFLCLNDGFTDRLVICLPSLFVSFESNHLIDPSRSRVDVRRCNVVFNLRKVVKGLEWQQLRAGFDPKQLETRTFATNKNICDLYTLTYKQGSETRPVPFTIRKAYKNEKKFLVLDLEPKVVEKKLENGTSSKDVINEEDKATEKDASAKRTVKTQSSNCVATEAAANSNQEKIDIKLSTAACGDNPTKTCSHSCDSDDDDDELEYLQTLTIHDGDLKEVVTNHKTKSAVDLKSSDLVYELDD